MSPRTAHAVLTPAALAAALLLAAGAAHAQSSYILNDRANNSLWRLTDLNGNGEIDEPAGVQRFFSAANAAGTPGPLNPTCLAVRRDGLVIFGDQDSSRRLIYLLRDLDGNGDAMGPGESRVAADASNASGASFAFPTGAAFDSRGRAYIVNAGNAFGDDRIYRLVDLDGNGDFQGPAEITHYVGEPFFGPGNGPFSPQEILFDADDTLYLRNSSANLHGVYAFRDLDGDGRADGPGEAVTFFDATNASGVTVGAGFAIALDPTRPRSIYYHQLAAGGVDQIFRLTDLNGDGDAQDAGEAVLVFSTGEPNFSSIDIVALADGRVFFTDNSMKRVIALRDLDGDGLFMSDGERTNLFTNSAQLIGDVRQLDPVFCPGDWDRNGVVNTADITNFLSDWFADRAGNTGRADFDFSLQTNTADITAFLAAWFAARAGGC